MSHALAAAVDRAMQWQPDLIIARPKLLTVPVAATGLGIPFVWVELTPTLTPTRPDRATQPVSLHDRSVRP